MKKPLFFINDIEECIINKRINRFIIEVEIKGNKEFVHINNTGKLKQWIKRNNIGYCYKINGNKLGYRLFSVRYDSKYGVLIDTKIHEKSFEMLNNEKGILYNCNIIKKYPRVNNIVFDYLASCGYIEVKSATLKYKEYVEYPDTYTKRGIEHIYNLINLKGNLIIVSGVPYVRKFRFNKQYGKEMVDMVKENIDKINIISYNIIYNIKRGMVEFDRFLEIDL